MYPLTLTHEERKVIDWIDYRYATGRPFWYLLIECDRSYVVDPIVDDTWDEFKGDITFQIPEHIAWQIKELFEQEELTFPCFSEEFKSKLLEWYWRIV